MFKHTCLLLFFLLATTIAICQSSEHIKFVRTTGRLPMLAYSLGEDRLGGAKMGYLDSNVLLKITDSFKQHYKVQLSAQHDAYIEKDYTKADSLFVPKPYYLSGSFSVKGVADSFDVVSIATDEKLPYKIWTEINPSKLILNIYGLQSNTNWIQQFENVKEIKNIYYNQIENDVLQVVIELNHRQLWGYSAAYTNKALTIKIKHQPQEVNLNKLVIAIDAGHGGSDDGAIGIKAKLKEKDYTLQIALALEKALKKRGMKVLMTRTKDSSFNTRDRAIWLQQKMPDLLVSIHLNSSANVNIQGVSTYYKHIAYKPLSIAILKQMLKLDLKEFGNIGSFNFTPNAITDFPNALVEVAFLSNEQDEAKIANPKFHQLVAEKIYLGIKDFLRDAIKSNP